MGQYRGLLIGRGILMDSGAETVSWGAGLAGVSKTLCSGCSLVGVPSNRVHVLLR